jgi:hypothetical protein
MENIKNKKVLFSIALSSIIALTILFVWEIGIAASEYLQGISAARTIKARHRRIFVFAVFGDYNRIFIRKISVKKILPYAFDFRRVMWAAAVSRRRNISGLICFLSANL